MAHAGMDGTVSTIERLLDSGRLRFPDLSTDLGELRLDGLTGTSVSALATAWALDGFKTAVDMGRCSARLAAQDTVLLTHCHSDHVAGLIAWLSAHTRRHRGRPTRVVVPESKRPALLESLARWPDLDGVRRRVDLEASLEGAGVGTVIEIPGGTATAFEVRHNTDALGWAIAEDGQSRPAVVFTGDSTVEPFREDPTRLDGRVAVVDCSFVEPGTRVAARLGGHAHLLDWLELLPDLACDRLVLAHLPSGLTAGRLVEHLPEPLPGSAEIVPWMAGPEVSTG